MKQGRLRRRIFLVAIICVGGFVGLGADPGAEHLAVQGPEPAIRLSPDPDHVVLDFALLPGLMDRPIVMTVSSGGAVLVDRPHGPSAGTYQMALTKDELAAFLAGIARHGLLEMTSESLQNRMSTARRPDGVVPVASDPSMVTAAFSFDAYGRSANDLAARPFERVVQFRHPGFYAKHYPHIEDFQALNAAVDSIMALLDDPRLQPVDAE